MSVLVLPTLLLACSRIPEADEGLGDAAATMFADFDLDDARVASVIRNLEREAYRDLDVDADGPDLRGKSVSRLSRQDVDHLPERPDRDPGLTLAVLLAYGSAFGVDAHAQIPVLKDQRPLEPQSPDHYDRTFLDGRACWRPRDCLWLATRQELTKVYPVAFINPLEYAFDKDYRWVDLATTEDPEPRWAFIARSYTKREYVSGGGNNVLDQSYTVETWIPRDGRGFTWPSGPPEDRPEAGDSTGGGTLRLLVVWSEASILGVDDPAIQEGVIRNGMNDNMNAHETWLVEHENAG
ncbi:MAG: hypothetical protein H6732_07180 [Alphaproteobacteria bacterium]|nr:hypothetical protein [Alphaproteobacteria bacterium]